MTDKEVTGEWYQFSYPIELSISGNIIKSIINPNKSNPVLQEITDKFNGQMPIIVSKIKIS